MNGLTRFQGFYNNIYRDPFVGGTAFVFITKPLLFIDPLRGSRAKNSSMAYLNMTRDPIFTSYLADQVMNSADRKIVEMLSYNTEYSTSRFIPAITNECKGFSPSDTTLEQSDSFDTKQGFKETLPTHKTISEAANSISISVTEDSNLSFTKMMTLWVNYISNITDGTFDANPEMILNGAIDYMSSIFYFVLGPDGRSLKYWAKYTGCWPTTIPYSTIRYTKGQSDLSEIDLQFVYNVKEDMNPKILEEFNMLSLNLPGTSYLKEKRYMNEISNQYSSIKESPLLNLNQLLDSDIPSKVLLKSEIRDPLIIYVPSDRNSANVDSTSNRFELIFDDNGYRSNLIPDIFETKEEKYYINDTATNFIKNEKYNDMNWNQTDFWTEETIE